MKDSNRLLFGMSLSLFNSLHTDTSSSLRDMTQETEQEQHKRITEMEKDFFGFDDFHGKYSRNDSSVSNVTDSTCSRAMRVSRMPKFKLKTSSSNWTMLLVLKRCYCNSWNVTLC